MLRCIEIFCTFLVHAIVFVIFHIGNFLSVSGFGHSICDFLRNEHAGKNWVGEGDVEDNV